MEDLYARNQAGIRQPPRSLAGSLRYLGPSLIVTANVVGSGELIMTTTLGARAGFVALWVILVSCLFKVAVQLEFGRHAIGSGETSLRAFQSLPGPCLRGVRWSVWVWLGCKGAQAIQYGGIVGGVALALHLAVPAVAVWQWTLLTGLVTALLVSFGHYRSIERISVALIAAFSLFTIACVAVLQRTPYRMSAEELLSGLGLHLPPEALGDRRGGLRHHRRECGRDHHLPILVPGEGLCPLHRPAGRNARVGRAGSRLDPRDVSGRAALHGHLHADHGGFLCARRRHPAPAGRSAAGL